IGMGSFASVSILSGRPVAFKHATVRSVELKTEFQVLRSLHDFCDTDSFFGVPRPVAFYDPHKSTSFLSVGGSPPSESRRRPSRSLELGSGGRPNRFFNSANFPLDVSRYRKLLEVAVDVYPSVEDIAYGMGEMLGRLHWHAGYGRDVEFVIS
ncbi:hypothetical protein JOM56_005549, partial [Amanita muscaria]